MQSEAGGLNGKIARAIFSFIASRLANIDILKNCTNISAVDFVQKKKKRCSERMQAQLPLSDCCICRKAYSLKNRVTKSDCGRDRLLTRRSPITCDFRLPNTRASSEWITWRNSQISCWQHSHWLCNFFVKSKRL